MSVIAGIAVKDIQFQDLVKMMLGRPGRKHIGHAGIKSAAQQGHDAAIFKPMIIVPLPLIAKPGFIGRLIVGRVHIIHAGFKACVHDMKILVWKRHIDHDIRLELRDERNHFWNIVRVHFGC